MVKKMRFKGKRLLTFCLVLCMIVSMCSTAFTAFAQDGTEETAAQTTEQTAEATEPAPAVTEPTEAATSAPATEATEAPADPTDSTEPQTTEAVEATEAEDPEETDSTDSTEAASETVTDNQEDSESLPPATISFLSVRGLEAVEDVTLRIDGVEKEEKITYPAGAIADNIGVLDGYLDSTKNQAFRRAVLVTPNEEDPENPKETEISRIGRYNGSTYYSYGVNDDTGILLEADEKIVIICESRHIISYSGFDANMGTVVGKTAVWEDEALEVSIKAADFYHISSIKVEWGDNTEQDFNVSNNKEMTLSLAQGSVTKNGKFTIIFEKDESYKIIEGQIQQGGIANDQGKLNDTVLGKDEDKPISPVAPGGTATFILYSDPISKWGDIHRDNWQLNMLQINDENVSVPKYYNVGSTAKTTLDNGSVVTVTLISTNEGLYWKGGESDSDWDEPDVYYGWGSYWDWRYERYLYEVTITNVSSDIVINSNFKKGTNPEMIMTGLEGIAKVGAAVTDMRVGNNGYDYYYSLETDEVDNVFPVHIKKIDMEGNQINFYLYSVLPGYNPYDIEIEFYSNGNKYSYDSKLFKGQEGSINYGIAMDRIKLDEDDPTGIGILNNYFKSAYRYFVYETEDDEGNKYTYNFYDDVYNNGYTHAFGLIGNLDPDKYYPQDETNGDNQMVILSASPYEYHLEFDLDGGTYEGTGINYNDYIVDNNNGLVTERKEPYTVENGAITVYMPLVNPVSEGKIFVGWQLVDENGEPVDNNIYNANQAYIIDASTVGFSTGDETVNEGHKFTFKAVWKDLIDEAGKASYTIKYYKEVAQDTEGAVGINGKYYELYHSGVELATIGSSVVVLNYRHPEPQENYVLDEVNSKLQIEKIVDTDDPTYEKNNSLIVLYNIKSYDLNITMTVNGDGDRTESFQVTVKAKDAVGNDLTGQIGNVTFVDGTATFEIKHGETVTIPGMDIGYNYEVVKDPVGEYETSYINNGVSVGENELVTGLFGKESITVDIVKSRKLPSATGVELGDNMAVSGFLIAAFAGIMLVVFSRRRRNV